MNCKTAAENFSAYVDNELYADDKLSFEEHIRNCGKCRRELDEMMQIVSLCSSLPQQELPAAFRSELHEKLLAASDGRVKKAAGLKKSKVYFTARMVASIAAGILLIFLAGIFYKYGFLTPTGTQNDTAELTASAEKTHAAMAAGAANSAKEKQTAGQESALEQSEAAAADAPADAAADTNRAPAIGALADGALADGASANGASAKRAAVVFGANAAAAAGKSTANAAGTDKNTGSVKAAGSSRLEGSGSAAASGGTAVSGRSTGDAPRQTQNAVSKPDASTEKVNNSLSNITVLSDDPVQQEEKIRTLVIENGGKDIDKLVVFSMAAPAGVAAKSTESTGQAIIESSEAVMANESAQAGREMKFLIPSANYGKFTVALNASFGATNIQMGAVVTEDSTSLLNSELLASSRLGRQIAELQKSGNTKDTDEIERLTSEKAAVDARINKLRLENGYIQLTIVVNSK